MDSYDSTYHQRHLVSSTKESDSLHHNSIKLDSAIVPLTNILNELVQLKYFLLTGPAQLRTQDGIHRHTLPNKEQISCIVWKNVYFITGTDIVRCLSFRFEAFGREITNRKKFEEGIFSDLRNLKCDTDAVLEQPKSEFLDYLYRNNCVRTQKKQKIFYWFSVNHDRLFQDALERDLKKELTSKKSSTTPVRDPALSFQYDGSRTLHDQLPDIIDKFPKPLADLTDASSIMSNVPFHPGQMVVMPPPPLPSGTFGPTPAYPMLGEVMGPMGFNQQSLLHSNTIPFYPGNSELVVPSATATDLLGGSQYGLLQYHQPKMQNNTSSNRPSILSAQPLSSSSSYASYNQEEQSTTHTAATTIAPGTRGMMHTTSSSDFPLDYVNTTNNGLASQMFIESAESGSGLYLPSSEQLVSTTDTYISPYSTTSAATSTAIATTPATATSTVAKNFSTPITYDNQQFQVVYHQDSAGNFLSSMVPLQSAVFGNPSATSSSTVSPKLSLTTSSSVTATGVASEGTRSTTSPLVPAATGGRLGDSSVVRPTKKAELSPAEIKSMHSPSLHQQQQQQRSPKRAIRIKEEDYHSSSNDNSPARNSVKRHMNTGDLPSTKRIKHDHGSDDKPYENSSNHLQQHDYHSASYFMLTPSESGCISDVPTGSSFFFSDSPNGSGGSGSSITSNSGFSKSFKRPGSTMVTAGSGVGGVPKRPPSAQRLPLVYQSSPVSQGDFFEDAAAVAAESGIGGTESSGSTNVGTNGKYLSTSFDEGYGEEWM